MRSDRNFLSWMRQLREMQMHFIAEIGSPQREAYLLNLLAELTPDPGKTLPGVRITELGREAGMSKPAVSQLLHRLESKKLVERAFSEEDRRAVYIRLTAVGWERHRAAMESYRKILSRIARELGPEDTEECLRLFDRIYNIFKKSGHTGKE